MTPRRCPPTSAATSAIRKTSFFKLQSQVYGLYHMTNPQVFFNREDLWTVATESASDENGQQTSVAMQPNFVLMKLPGEATDEFVEILPFTPSNRNNLSGWIAGRCDGANYGTSIVYDFPKTRLVDGPQQIEARIDQNAQLSGQLTLWNQQGSHVRRGSLLVIPSGRALLYAEPIYLQVFRPAKPHAGAHASSCSRCRTASPTAPPSPPRLPRSTTPNPIVADRCPLKPRNKSPSLAQQSTSSAPSNLATAAPATGRR